MPSPGSNLISTRKMRTVDQPFDKLMAGHSGSSWPPIRQAHGGPFDRLMAGWSTESHSTRIYLRNRRNNFTTGDAATRISSTTGVKPITLDTCCLSFTWDVSCDRWWFSDFYRGLSMAFKPFFVSFESFVLKKNLWLFKGCNFYPT